MSMLSTHTPTLKPERKYYPALNNASVRMAPADCEWAGWLDLGDAVALAYGPFGDYSGAADPRDSARIAINKVRSEAQLPNQDLARILRGC